MLQGNHQAWCSREDIVEVACVRDALHLQAKNTYRDGPSQPQRDLRRAKHGLHVFQQLLECTPAHN
jgi:hypothetical protein